jgi:hypothetical protein
MNCNSSGATHVSVTKQRCTILHITDLHLSEIGVGSHEFLRVGYYDEYVRNMWTKMSSQLSSPVDLIVATGDFVDRGRTENFSHARQVLLAVARLVGLDESRVAVCIGNHDIVREKELAGQHDLAREAYRAFSADFSKGRMRESSHRATLFEYDGGIFFLMLDGTRGATKADVPATIDSDVADHLINDFVRKVPEDKLLIVGSHYPIAPFPDDFGIRVEGPDYVEKHFWTSAIAFKKRVSSLRTKAPTLWLFGDVHNSDAYSEHHHYHVITGRLGVRVPVPPHPESQRPRQARAVVLEWDSNSACRVITGNFLPSTHHPQPEIGEWIVESSDVRRTGAVPNDQVKGDATTPPAVSPTPASTVSAVLPQPLITVLDRNLSTLIYEKIRNEGLYRMGRFRTTGARDSLAWISVGQILGTGTFLARFVGASLAWLTKTQSIKPHVNGHNVLFLGIDCWGASVATLLGAACGAPALCVAVRADGRYHTVGELVDETVVSAVEQSDIVVLVTDVIVTGRSIAALYSRVKELKPAAIRAEQRWLGISVLMDANQSALASCPFLTGVGVACGDIKLPGIQSAMLPGEDIAPAVVSFS